MYLSKVSISTSMHQAYWFSAKLIHHPYKRKTDITKVSCYTRIMREMIYLCCKKKILRNIAKVNILIILTTYLRFNETTHNVQRLTQQ